MAFKAFLITIFIAVAIVPALATDYMVGGDDGWKLGINYTNWAAGKDFRVGDTLMFMYKSGSHNVLAVNGADFKQCVSSNATTTKTEGNDVISLTSPGKKWYICGINDHCSKGMKLFINVSTAEGPAPSPMPGTSVAGEVSPLKSCMWMVAIVAIYRMITA